VRKRGFLRREPGFPGCVAELRAGQFRRHLGVPGSQRRAALPVPGAHCQEREQDDGDDERAALEDSGNLVFHSSVRPELMVIPLT